MALPSTREALKQYCLRKLGFPVVQINTDDDQLEDRIDETIQWWNENHIHGSETVFFKHTLTAANIANKSIDTTAISDHIMSVNQVIDLSASNGNDKTLSDMWQFTATISDIGRMGGSLSDYVTQMQYISSWKNILSHGFRLEFQRYSKELKVYNLEWSQAVADESYIVIECTVANDESINIWNDRIIKKYCTAQFKMQWGENMKKFDQVVLLGGVTMNGQKIWDEGREEIAAIEEYVDDTPMDFFIG